jgi:hypothetical protein
VAVAVALGATLAGAIAPPISRAEPAPDLEHARELYRSAEAAMKDGRYDDAARDYGAAYELSTDPALFYKIGHANERAGKCDVALVYYARYLREGKPTEQFTALTQERIAACGGDRAGGSPGAGAAGATGATGATGSAGAGAAPGPSDASGAAGGTAGPAAGPGASPAGSAAGRASGAGSGPATGTAHPGSAGSTGPAQGGSASASAGSAAATGAGGAAGTASPEVPAGGPAAASGSGAAALIPPTREKIAWLVGGGAIAMATLGGVLAYAASSSENDVRDLYAGFAGQAPPFDGPTRKRYNDLVDEGRRYQHLSWAAFGLAGAAAVGVAVLFTVGRGDEPAPPRGPAVTPVVGAHGAGVSVRF